MRDYYLNFHASVHHQSTAVYILAYSYTEYTAVVISSRLSMCPVVQKKYLYLPLNMIQSNHFFRAQAAFGGTALTSCCSHMQQAVCYCMCSSYGAKVNFWQTSSG